MKMRAKFEDLIGKTLVEVTGEIDGDEIIFVVSDYEKCHLYHSQDCCEHVVINDINGDFSDLLNTPIIVAEERVSEIPPDGIDPDPESETWTFYTLRTIKGSVDIRWHGTSNGYYSESVDFGMMEAVSKW
jgi:hypothetical protein